MGTLSRPRRGSLQFWPRKRARKVLPSVNWKPIKSDSKSILGFITYKAGMSTAIVKDKTEKSMTLNKSIVLPVTILEAPNMKIFSVRFYLNGLAKKDVVVSLDKILKKLVKVPVSLKNFDSEIPENYDNMRVIVYSLPSQTAVKKTPDMIELAISGNKEEQLSFVKSFIGKEISVFDFIDKHKMLDVRALTTGRGMQGPVKRFGIRLRHHKSEKGVRKVGSIAPWHPARVTFRTPMAGQLGYFTRVHYNLPVVTSGKIQDKNINPKQGFKNYGNVKSNYIVLKGSVQGPVKRQVLLTSSIRPSKAQKKHKFEFQELI